jgi:hypothetical protein
MRSITFALLRIATVVPLLSLSLNTPKRSGSLKANRSLKRQKMFLFFAAKPKRAEGAPKARGIAAEPRAREAGA